MCCARRTSGHTNRASGKLKACRVMCESQVMYRAMRKTERYTRCEKAGLGIFELGMATLQAAQTKATAVWDGPLLLPAPGQGSRCHSAIFCIPVGIRSSRLDRSRPSDQRALPGGLGPLRDDIRGCITHCYHSKAGSATPLPSPFDPGPC